MSKALKPADSRMGGVVFELESFEFAEQSGCQLRGRWFGVRGRRFMRPTLTLVRDGRETRLLADLAHKPWDAQDGEPWQAAFPGNVDEPELLEAELTVAPDITIELPTPSGAAGAARVGTSSRRAGPTRSRGAASGTATRSRERTNGPPRSDRTAFKGGLGALTRELADAQQEIRQLKRALAGTEAAKAQAAMRLTTALDELERLTHARDDALRNVEQTAAERDQATAERDGAHRALEEARGNMEELRSALESAAAERRAALAARDEALSERDAGLAALDQAASERDALVKASKQATTARDAALAGRDQAVSARDAALRARDDAVAQCDAALAACRQAAAERAVMKSTSERLERELAEERAARDAARNATRVHRLSGRPAGMASGVAAIAVLAVVILAILLGFAVI